MRLFYLTAEGWPTFRADITVLFGKYLPRYEIYTDLVTEAVDNSVAEKWQGGESILFNAPRARSAFYIIKFFKLFSLLLRVRAEHYDAIQVRDMPVIAVFALLISNLKGLPFIYWMSFPQSEGQIFRAKARGYRAGMKFWFPLMQGYIGKKLLYSLVLPNAHHIFVQSEQMLEDVAREGVLRSKMTPVPMGVDLEVSDHHHLEPAQDAMLKGKRIIVYLGTLDRARKVDMLFDMLAIAKNTYSNLLLVIVGDTEDKEYREWLQLEAKRLGVMDAILWTGWLSTEEAWRYVRAAEIGLSPFPRGFLLDSASPTKAVEYMAMGLPVVVNDNPDQKQLVADSGGGLCVNLEAQSFSEAVITLLSDDVLRSKMSESGRAYIKKVRGYDSISASVAKAYVNAINVSN